MITLQCLIADVHILSGLEALMNEKFKRPVLINRPGYQIRTA